MSIKNVNGALAAAYSYAGRTQKNNAAKTDSAGFLSAVSAKAAEKTKKAKEAEKAKGAEKTERSSFEELWKLRYPGAYYHVMDGSQISQAVWDRNDFPFEKFFSDNVDKSILNWRPSGPEPSDRDPSVIARRSSAAGQKAVIAHPALEEKMKNDPELAERVMQNLENWIAEYPAEPGCSYLIELNEDGEIAKFCVAGPLKISHSVTETGREKVDQLHEEYERIAKENALKRSLREQGSEKEHEADKRILGIGSLKGPGNMRYGMRAEYAENYSADNPVITVKVQKGNGRTEEYDIDIRKVDPQAASEIEMFALCSYADVSGNGTGGTFGSWQTMNYYRNNAAHNGYFEMTNTMEAFRSVKQDWAFMIGAMIDDYLNSGLLGQAMDGRRLLGILDGSWLPPL